MNFRGRSSSSHALRVAGAFIDKEPAGGSRGSERQAQRAAKITKREEGISHSSGAQATGTGAEGSDEEFTRPFGVDLMTLTKWQWQDSTYLSITTSEVWNPHKKANDTLTDDKNDDWG